ncbi:HesA/MoeB/ThiF family protein [Leeia aquatica]|uniref:Molybdopterin-synthase adenylyltransferase n=1 Tax=Leeia aquatica TaxID=2725557 RepID=A0A847RV06_9NEIS|nr:molybdopterin-synthase adenylyltransferase MoeB [Leeia aquatica]NLR75030.1 molybdopterin-synthase adenylyltransferase MoeB [Leeia aquatica]
MTSNELSDSQLLRYSRHILLEELGIEGQQQLLAAKVLVVGMGGLGSAATPYLAAGGIGALHLADGDQVDLTNLQRQIVHHESRVGMNKAQSAAVYLQQLNPALTLQLLPQDLAADSLAAAVSAVDLVLDCSDRFATRQAVNQACVAAAKPLVSGSALGFAGQLVVFDVRQANSPCYHCLFPAGAETGEQRCATFGVLSPLVGVIGALQATEAIKRLCGLDPDAVGRLLMYDSLRGDWRSIRVPRDPACPVCHAR